MSKRVWFLRDGEHLCRGLFGIAGDEYGRQTCWVRVPGGVMVCAIRYWTWNEVLRDYADGDVPTADLVWSEFQEARRAAGISKL